MVAKRQGPATQSGASAPVKKVVSKTPVAEKRPAASKVAEKVTDKYATAPVKKKVVRKKVAATAATPVAKANPGVKPTVSAEERERLVRAAAFLISSKRNPCDGNAEVDWCQAEAVIDMIFDIKG